MKLRRDAEAIKEDQGRVSHVERYSKMTGVCFGNLIPSSLIFVSYSSLKFSLSLEEKISLPRIRVQSIVAFGSVLFPFYKAY